MVELVVASTVRLLQKKTHLIDNLSSAAAAPRRLSTVVFNTH